MKALTVQEMTWVSGADSQYFDFKFLGLDWVFLTGPGVLLFGLMDIDTPGAPELNIRLDTNKGYISTVLYYGKNGTLYESRFDYAKLLNNFLK